MNQNRHESPVDKWSERLAKLELAVRHFSAVQLSVGTWQTALSSKEVNQADNDAEMAALIDECNELRQLLDEKLVGEGIRALKSELRSNFPADDPEQQKSYFYFFMHLTKVQDRWRPDDWIKKPQPKS
jgi:hypothetical protein